MIVYLIKRDTMGGSDFMKKAFLDKRACSLNCVDLKEEWVGYEPFKAEGEEIGGNRVIVDGKVYDLDKTDSKDVLKAKALKKLTKEEKDALGV